jgi:parallel beta-helix repeat protein
MNNGLVVEGEAFEQYVQAEVVNNSLNGNPLVYWQHRRGDAIPVGATQVVLVNCTQIMITKQNFTHTSIGILAAYSSALEISHNRIINNSMDGIHLVNSGTSILFKNTISQNSRSGIHLFHSGNISVSENIINQNEGGIRLEDSGNSTISNNTVSNNDGGGVYLSLSENTTISENTVSNNGGVGIDLENSGNNGITHNILVNNGLVVNGESLEEYMQAEVVNNSVDGNPLVFWQHRMGDAIPTGAAQVVLVNCTQITITKQNFTHASIGILAAYSSALEISHNRIINNSMDGIRLVNSGTSTISKNTISQNGGTILGNTLTSNSGYGVSLESTRDCVVTGNEFIDNNPLGSSQAYDDGLNNTFYYNYWNEWTAPDTNQDGIVDVPYPIDGAANNQDAFPLTTPPSENFDRFDHPLPAILLLGGILGALGLLILTKKGK